MAALTGARKQLRYGGEYHEHGVLVKGSTKIYSGALVAKGADGYAVPMSAATGLVAIGVAQETVDNTGADGAARVRVQAGIFGFASGGAGDALAETDRGAEVYGIDDQTVGKTDGGGARSKAGRLIHVENGVFYVQVAGLELG